MRNTSVGVQRFLGPSSKWPQSPRANAKKLIDTRNTEPKCANIWKPPGEFRQSCPEPRRRNARLVSLAQVEAPRRLVEGVSVYHQLGLWHHSERVRTRNETTPHILFLMERTFTRNQFLTFQQSGWLINQVAHFQSNSSKGRTGTHHQTTSTHWGGYHTHSHARVRVLLEGNDYTCTGPPRSGSCSRIGLTDSRTSSFRVTHHNQRERHMRSICTDCLPGDEINPSDMKVTPLPPLRLQVLMTTTLNWSFTAHVFCPDYLSFFPSSNLTTLTVGFDLLKRPFSYWNVFF